MKKLSGIFLKGLAAVLPLLITVYLLYWLGSSAEALLGAALKQVLPERWYLPGMGVAAGIALVFALGVLLNAYLVQKLWAYGERVLQRVPLVKSVYGAVQDLTNLVSGDQEKALGQVVTVPLGDTGYRVIGFVTRRDLSDLPEGLAAADQIAVYAPMSYQIGGYTLLVPREAVTPVDMSVEQGMRFAVTAGVSTARPKSTVEGAGKADRAKL